MKGIFLPHELKTIEVDTEKKIFKINGEDFGKGCTGFSITCHSYNSFDIRVEIETTVKYVSIRNGKVADEKQYETDEPWFGDSAEQADQVEQPG